MRAYALLLIALLSACSHSPKLPQQPHLRAALPLTLHIERRQADQLEHWLLVIQEHEQALRWSLFNPLGSPLARQRLSQGQWHAEGFLPPNAEARELFSALVLALNEPAQLRPGWQIQYHAPLNLTLEHADRHYRVTAMNMENNQ